MLRHQSNATYQIHSLKLRGAYTSWLECNRLAIAASDCQFCAMRHERYKVRLGGLLKLKRGAVRRQAVLQAAEAALALASDVATLSSTRAGFARWFLWTWRVRQQSAAKVEESETDAAARALAADAFAAAAAAGSAVEALRDVSPLARSTADDRSIDEVAAAAVAVTALEAQLADAKAAGAAQAAELRAVIEAAKQEAVRAAEEAADEVERARVDAVTARSEARDAETAERRRRLRRRRPRPLLLRHGRRLWQLWRLRMPKSPRGLRRIRLCKRPRRRRRVSANAQWIWKKRCVRKRSNSSGGV